MLTRREFLMATAALSGFCPSLFAFVDGQPIAAPVCAPFR